MTQHKYDSDNWDYPTSSPLTMLRPDAIRVLTVSSGVMAFYQNQMSKAVWRPAPGRKLGFIVVQGDILLGLIFLATPVIRLSARDEYLFPEAKKNPQFNYGWATQNYMDMSVCVAAQPLGWYWNLGKLMALIAPTLGDYVLARYPRNNNKHEGVFYPNEFLGVTTTSLYGRSVQYNRIYQFLGFTKGFGHEHISDAELKAGVERLRDHCPNCTPGCEDPLPLIPKHVLIDARLTKGLHPKNEWCTVPYARFGDGVNARMRRWAAVHKAFGDKSKGKGGKGIFYHGHKRGVYFHASTPPEQRPAVIQQWYARWGLPRYERLKNQVPPYQNGVEGGQQYSDASP